MDECLRVLCGLRV